MAVAVSPVTASWVVVICWSAMVSLHLVGVLLRDGPGAALLLHRHVCPLPCFSWGPVLPSRLSMRVLRNGIDVLPCRSPAEHRGCLAPTLRARDRHGAGRHHFP